MTANMSRLSDLVRDSRLDTRIQGDVTCHRLQESDPTGRERAIIRKEYWKKVKRIGSGGFGNVWLQKCVKGEKDLQWRALKEIPKPDTSRSGGIDYTRELEALAKFSQQRYVRCFVRSLGWYESDTSICIAMEYFPLGDLAHHLTNASPLSKDDVQPILHQLLEGLSILHENGFAHRDLKPGNILIQSKNPWWVKIGDFGISKRVEEGREASSTVKGTLVFMAPEMHSFVDKSELCTDAHSAACATDIWALGEMTFQMLTKQSMFANLALTHAYTRDLSVFPANVLLQAGHDNDCVDLIRRLAHPSPKRRLCANDAMKYSWVTSFRPSSPRPLSVSSNDFSDIETTSFAKTKNYPKTKGISEPSGVWSTKFPSEEPATIAFGSGTNQEGTTGQYDGYFGTFGQSTSIQADSRSHKTNPSVPHSGYEQSPPHSTPNSHYRGSAVSQAEQSSRSPGWDYPSQQATPQRQVNSQPLGYPSPPDTSERTYTQNVPPANPPSAPWQTPPQKPYGDLHTPVTWTGQPQSQYGDPRLQAHMRSTSSEFDAYGRPTVSATFDAYGRPVYHEQQPQISSGFVDRSQHGLNAYNPEAWNQTQPQTLPSAFPGEYQDNVQPPMPHRSYSSPMQSHTYPSSPPQTGTSAAINEVQNGLSGLSIAPEKPSSSSNVVIQKGIVMFDLSATQNGDLALTKGDNITITQRTEHLEDFWVGFTADGRVGRFPGYAVWLPPTGSASAGNGNTQSTDLLTSNSQQQTTQHGSVQEKHVPQPETIEAAATVTAPQDPSDNFEMAYTTANAIRLFRGNIVADLSQSADYIQGIQHATWPPPPEYTSCRYTAITTGSENFVSEDYVLRPSIFTAPRPTEVLITINLEVWPDLLSFSRFLHAIFDDVSRMLKDESYEEYVGPNPWKSVVIAIISSEQLNNKETAFLQALGIDVRFSLLTEEGQPFSFFDDSGDIVGELYRKGQGVESIGRRMVTAQLYECTTRRYVEVSTGGAVVRSGEGGCPIQLVFLDEDCDDDGWAEALKSSLDATCLLEYHISEDGEVPDVPRDSVNLGWQLAHKTLADAKSSDPILSTRVSIEVGTKGMNAFGTKFKRGVSIKSRKNDLHLYNISSNPGSLSWTSMYWPDINKTLSFWSQGFWGYVLFLYKDQWMYVNIMNELNINSEDKCAELIPPMTAEDERPAPYLFYFESAAECQNWIQSMIAISNYAVELSNPGCFGN